MSQPNTPNQITDVPLLTIVPSRWQPRQTFDADQLLELATSIQEHGLLDPILVFYNEDGEPELVAGERRVRASIALALVTTPSWTAAHGDELKKAVQNLAKHGWGQLVDNFKADLAEVTILARVLEGLADADLHKIALVENLQRESLSPLEEAAALQGLQDELGLSQRQLADHIGKSQGWVQQRLALLDAAPAIQDRVNTRVFTPTHVRAFAGLPEGVQTAIADRVEQMLKAEGDTSTTTRKVQAFGSSAREFLQPDHWDVPPTAEANGQLQIGVRNGRMLVAHLLRTTGEEQLGQVVIRLKEAQVLGKKPDSIDDQSLGTILSAFTSDRATTYTSLGSQWETPATQAGFTCDSCLWTLVRDAMPVERPLDTGCHRLDWKRDQVRTCAGYIRRDDPRWPATLPLHRDIAYLIPETDGRTTKQYGFRAASPTDYLALYREAMDARQRKEAASRAADAKAHLAPMRGYQALQTDPDTFLDLDHAQAHACRRCILYRPDQPVDGVTCAYAANPKKKPGWNTPQSPDYRLMVRRDGKAVPRCDYFVAAGPATLIDAEPGTLPRKAALSWFHHLFTGKGNYHEWEIPRLLSWLIHPDDDTERRVRRVRDLWDQTSDGHIIRLMNVLVSERVAANQSNNSSFNLVNPKTGETEEWSGIGWDVVMTRKPPERFSHSRLPDGWRMPWVPGQGQPKAPASPAAYEAAQDTSEDLEHHRSDDDLALPDALEAIEATEAEA